MSRLFAALGIMFLAAGCGADRKVNSAPREAVTRPGRPAVTPAFKPLSIQPNAAGPIRLGMTRAAAKKIEGFVISPAVLRLEGTATPVLRYERAGEVVALAEFEGETVSRIRVLSPQFRTPEGAHVGSTARELAKRYGTGKPLVGEGVVCAVFARSPGHSFCFRTTPDLLVKPDWKKVTARNPSVESILVVPVQ